MKYTIPSTFDVNVLSALVNHHSEPFILHPNELGGSDYKKPDRQLVLKILYPSEEPDPITLQQLTGDVFHASIQQPEVYLKIFHEIYKQTGSINHGFLM